MADFPRPQWIAADDNRFGVPVLDLHGHLSAPEVVDSGFLWWDYVHLSSYGHRRAAEWLAPQLLPELRALLRGAGAP